MQSQRYHGQHQHQQQQQLLHQQAHHQQQHHHHHQHHGAPLGQPQQHHQQLQQVRRPGPARPARLGFSQMSSTPALQLREGPISPPQPDQTDVRMGSRGQRPSFEIAESPVKAPRSMHHSVGPSPEQPRSRSKAAAAAAAASARTAYVPASPMSMFGDDEEDDDDEDDDDSFSRSKGPERRLLMSGTSQDDEPMGGIPSSSDWSQSQSQPSQPAPARRNAPPPAPRRGAPTRTNAPAHRPSSSSLLPPSSSRRRQRDEMSDFSQASQLSQDSSQFSQDAMFTPVDAADVASNTAEHHNNQLKMQRDATKNAKRFKRSSNADALSSGIDDMNIAGSQEVGAPAAGASSSSSASSRDLYPDMPSCGFYKNPYLPERDQPLSRRGPKPGSDMFNSKFKIGRKLGRGSFGEVHEVTHRITGVKYAVKILRNVVTKTHFTDAIREAKINAALQRAFSSDPDRQYFVQFFDVFVAPGSGPVPRLVYIQYELCDDSLGGMEHPVHSDMLMVVLEQMSRALALLHRHAYFHLDIKPDNILSVSEPATTFKLGDFGLTVRQDIDVREDASPALEGDDRFLAPEMLEGAHCDLQKVDIYALGLTILYMSQQTEPSKTQWMSIKEGAAAKPDSMSEELYLLVQEMVHRAPSQRPTAQKVVDWFERRRWQQQQQQLQQQQQQQQHPQAYHNGFPATHYASAPAPMHPGHSQYGPVVPTRPRQYHS